jgi:pimeloyl-ACP methyl ester carboxylesterase
VDHHPPPAGSEQQPGESDDAYPRRSMRAMVSPRDPAAVTDAELEWMLASRATLPIAKATLAADYRAQDWRPLCPVIDVPVLVAAGRYSGALPGNRYAAEHIPGARLVMFEDSGHCLFYNEPEKFNRVVVEFVNGA